MCCVCLCHKVGNAAFLLTRTGSKPLCPLLSDSKSRLQAETDPEAADTSQVLNSLAPDRRQVDLRRFPKKLCRHVCSIYPFSCSELDRPRRSALDPETPRPRHYQQRCAQVGQRHLKRFGFRFEARGSEPPGPRKSWPARREPSELSTAGRRRKHRSTTTDFSPFFPNS